ncbi:hypothetical protein ES707_19946 [subsurface metagenome]
MAGFPAYPEPYCQPGRLHGGMSLKGPYPGYLPLLPLYPIHLISFRAYAQILLCAYAKKHINIVHNHRIPYDAPEKETPGKAGEEPISRLHKPPTHRKEVHPHTQRRRTAHPTGALRDGSPQARRPRGPVPGGGREANGREPRHRLEAPPKRQEEGHHGDHPGPGAGHPPTRGRMKGTRPPLSSYLLRLDDHRVGYPE